MISLVAPVGNIKGKYAISLRKNIEELYPDKSKVELILYENDNVTLGTKFNMAVDMAKGEKIILLHDDMILKPGFVELMDKYIEKNKIVTYTRVEPPIYNDLYPGKIIEDCGFDLEDFNEEKFYSVKVEDKAIPGGSQIFFGCLKEDYIGVDGNTFKMFCEDDDIHLRYKLGGYESIVCPAQVYHFVSKTSRAQSDYSKIEFASNKNFIRKWGFRSMDIPVKYNIAYVVKNCNLQLLGLLELWCDRIYIKDDIQVLTSHYIDQEQPNTTFDLSKRILCIGHNDPIGENDIVVEFDAKQLTNKNFELLQQLPAIIKDSGEVGEFELDIFKITIHILEEKQNDLIKCNSFY